MKIKSLVILSGILVFVSICSATVVGLLDSNNDGIVEGQVSVLETETQDINKATREATASWYDLEVQAEGNEANADPGGTDNANILVVVTYNGAPVDILTQDDFTLKTILVPPGYGAVEVVAFNNYGNGGYTFQVVPIKGITWGAGEYDIQVSVSYGGQAIASIEVV